MIWEGLLERSWDARPSKMELSLTRNAHFRKITFFASGSFFDEFGRWKRCQNTAKIPPKNDKKINAFFTRKSIDFGAEMEVKGRPGGGTQYVGNRPRTALGGTLAPPGGKMTHSVRK